VIDEPLPDLTVPADQERRLMFQAVRRLLHNVVAREAPQTGVLLVLDDLQWAGSDAIELLTASLRTSGTHGNGKRTLMVIGAMLYAMAAANPA
jgi:predicted ATPase